MTKDELVQEIIKLHSKFDNVKEYYQSELLADSSVLDKYKKQITKEFFPYGVSGRPGDARAAILRKMISDFTKVAVFEVDVIELILHRVEMAVAFTAAYGDIDMPFYTAAENNFDKVCTLIVKNKLIDKYNERCANMIWKVRDFGWGFFDSLSGIMLHHFENAS